MLMPIQVKSSSRTYRVHVRVIYAPRDVAGWVSAMTAILVDPWVSAGLSSAGAAVAAGVTWERGATALRGLLSSVATGDITVSSPEGSSPQSGNRILGFIPL